MQNVFVLLAPTTALELYRQIAFSVPTRLLCRQSDSIDWLPSQLSLSGRNISSNFLGNKNSKYAMGTYPPIEEHIARNTTYLLLICTYIRDFVGLCIKRDARITRVPTQLILGK